MTEELKNKIITRAIHFIATNTKPESDRIGAAIIEELRQVKLFAIPVVSNNEVAVCSCVQYHYGESNDDGDYICCTCGGVIKEQTDC